MYARGGFWYVYLCYGVHEMLNLVVGPRDWPAAVLIRGVEGLAGPGRVTKTLVIDRRLNAKPAARASGLWLEDRGVHVPRGAVRATPRIGVAYAGPVWATKRWRFVIEVGACLQAISMRPIACKQAPTKMPARPRPRSNSSPSRA